MDENRPLVFKDVDMICTEIYADNVLFLPNTASVTGLTVKLQGKNCKYETILPADADINVGDRFTLSFAKSVVQDA